MGVYFRPFNFQEAPGSENEWNSVSLQFYNIISLQLLNLQLALNSRFSYCSRLSRFSDVKKRYPKITDFCPRVRKAIIKGCVLLCSNALTICGTC